MAGTIVVDSSALAAVVFREEGFEEFSRKMLEADRVAIGAPTLLELSIVLCDAMGPEAESTVWGLVRQYSITVIPWTGEHAGVAMRAFLRYGRKRHPAALNFGDCLSYAAASVAGAPLLFKGDDFARTDIRAA